MKRHHDIAIQLEDDTVKQLPTHWEICPTCRGEGKSSAYLGAFTQDQMDEDPDFAEDYRKGAYDRACDDCGGSGKIKVPDFDRMSKADAATYRAQVADDHEIDAIQAQELQMERGWRDMGAYGRG